MNSEKIKEAIKNNSNYWEKRALENKLNVVENEEDYLNRITAIYDQANKDIEDKLAKVYARYAKENGMTLDEAYQKLPKSMEKKYKNDVMDYVEKAKSGDPKWKQYLLNQSMMHSHSVLDQLRTEYRNVVYNIDMETTGGKFLEKIFANSNYKAQFDNNEEAFAKVDQDKIKSLLEENWSGGGNFSELIWKDREKLVKALDDIVIRGLATGENFDKMAEKLAKRMDTSKSNAKRLIMTESARMDNEGLLAYYKETDVKKLIFVATLDMRTSDICRAMDGEIIPIDRAQIGLNVPPLHPYCRSVISPYYEDNVSETRMYRDKDTGKSTKGDYKDYVDYLARHLGDKKQAEALASTKNDLATLMMAVNDTVNIFQSNDQISINPEQDLIKKNADNYENFKSKYADEFTEEMEAQIEKDLKVLLDENDMATRTSIDSMLKIIEDGKIKSQFEGVESSTRLDTTYRAKVEKTLFGYQDTLPDNLRPIYGYLTNFKNGFDGSSSNGTIMYGNVAIKLKKDTMKDRTTFTVGDSLDGVGWAEKVPNLYTNPTKTSLYPFRSLTDEYGKFTGKLDTTMEGVTRSVNYVELQFHGGNIVLNDIEKVYIYKSIETWKGKEALNIDTVKLSKLEKALKKANIDYEVVE